MKTRKIILFAFLTLFAISCKNSNQEFIDKLKEQAANNELGVDLKYKVINFELIDTLYNQDRADSLLVILNNNIEGIKNLDLSKDVFLKFKDQELNLRSDKNYYKNIVFNDDYSSEWLTELRNILSRTDSVLLDFDNANVLVKFELYSWFNRRYWQFNQNLKYEKTYNDYYESAVKLNELEKEISTLMKNPKKIIHFKAKVNFEQVNPLLGGAKQNLTVNKYFDENKDLIVQ